MRKRGACLAFAVLSVICFAAPPTPAYALRIGPFHLGVPFSHRHHQHRHFSTHSNTKEARRSEPRQDEATRQGSHQTAWALLYPSRALPTIFQNIFWPAFSSPWPFGYESIFATAFAPASGDADVDQCRADGTAVTTRRRHGSSRGVSGQVLPGKHSGAADYPLAADGRADRGPHLGDRHDSSAASDFRAIALA